MLFGRLRPNFCKVGIAPVTGISSTDIQIIRSKRGEIWREFLLFYLTDTEFIDYCDQLATGTRMPRVSWDDMCDYSIPIPPVDRVEEFHENVSPMIEMIVSNIQEANTLDSMKNTLHPNIISGKIGPERLCLDKLGGTKNNVIE
jgi:type I restriction enzyme S subunit